MLARSCGLSPDHAKRERWDSPARGVTVLGRPALKKAFQPTGSSLGRHRVDRPRDEPDPAGRRRGRPSTGTARSSATPTSPKRPKHDTLWETEPYDIETIVTEYTVVKNGMRFPGKMTIVRSVSTVLGGKCEWPMRERETVRVTQEYSNYEFFSVRTSEEIKRFVAKEAKLPSTSVP
jgi:hypothetical protein